MKKPLSPAESVSKVSKSDLVELKAKWAVDLGLEANPTSQYGAPISFTAHLDSILPGQTFPLNTSALANGFRTPYVIDEIRMQAYMTTPVASANAVQASTAMSFQFRTGAYAFSNVPVPMILHQPQYVITPFVANVPLPVLATFVEGGQIVAGDEARWHLAKPLWMAPGDQIQAVVARSASIANLNNASFAVDVTYVGRSLPPGTPGPKTRFVPWAAHYIHDFANLYSQTTTEFRNPFTFPMTIQKLIGRSLSKATNGVTATGRLNMLPNAAGTKYAAIYMEDSLGYKITRSAIAGKFSPVGSVFDTDRVSWTFSRPLGAREQLNMMFQTLGTVGGTDRLFGVSMLGYREETA